MESRTDGQMIVKGRLTQVGRQFRNWYGKRTRKVAVFRCECGQRIVTRIDAVMEGRTVSCGCWNLDDKRTHRMTGTKIHKVWGSMRERCALKNHPSWKNYGGRGISVCERWQTFEHFYADMGDIPFPGAQLDRIDNDGNYEPGNCRWATCKENCRNKSNAVIVEFNGRKMNVSEIEELAAVNGVNANTVRSRIVQMGWDIQRAITTPARKLKSNG